MIHDEDAKELFEDHFHRQLTHRYAGTLASQTTVKPEKIVRQIALFVGTYYVTKYLKSEPTMSPENKLKCANTMLKIEIRSLGKDLERREDLCDDLLNEIYRHERKIDIKAAENDELILKNKSRLAKINILKEELRKLGDRPKSDKKGPASPAKSFTSRSGSSKDKKKKAEKEKAKQVCSSDTSETEEKWLYGSNTVEQSPIRLISPTRNGRSFIYVGSKLESLHPNCHNSDSDSGIDQPVTMKSNK